MTAILSLYRLITALSSPVLAIVLRKRLKEGKEDSGRLHERIGNPKKPRPTGNLVWIHAASVGEAQSALILINAINQKFPHVHILVTSGTVTSAKLMGERLPSCAFHQFVPLDHPAWVSGFLTHWNPTLVLWMESELWPNMLLSIKQKNIPATLVNARLSDSSYSRWKLVKSTAKQLLSCFSLILAQTQEDAARFQSLGHQHVIVSGNLKYSAVPLPVDSFSLSALKNALGPRPCWVYASTHAGEESMACRLHLRLKKIRPDLLTIIVPRHPVRRGDISKICSEHNVKYRLRSHDTALPQSGDDIYIADTMGELGLFYTLCAIAVIGRSFSDDGGGGHNPIEAAQFGCAVITGPNNQFQRELYNDLRKASAVIETKDERELASVLEKLLTEPDTLKALQKKTDDFINQKTPVIDDVMVHIAPLLETIERQDAI